MNIRPHRVGDLGWIIAKHGEVYSEEFSFDASFELNIAEKIVAFFNRNDPISRIWIAAVNGQRAGSIAVSRQTDRIGFINFVLVLDAYRGQGIARKLMETVIQHAIANTIKSLELETFDCLHSARELYRLMGFEIVDGPNDVELFGQSLQQEIWRKIL